MSGPRRLFPTKFCSPPLNRVTVAASKPPPALISAQRPEAAWPVFASFTTVTSPTMILFFGTRVTFTRIRSLPPDDKKPVSAMTALWLGKFTRGGLKNVDGEASEVVHGVRTAYLKPRQYHLNICSYAYQPLLSPLHIRDGRTAQTCADQTASRSRAS